MELGLIFKIGLPTCIQNSVTGLSFMFLTTIINIVGGVSASAAVGAVGKFNSFAFMPTQAISASIGAMAAQNIGGGHTMFTLITNMLSAVLLRVPVCYFLGVTLGWGLSGVGLGAPAASAGALLVIAVYLFSGAWKFNAVKLKDC